MIIFNLSKLENKIIKNELTEKEVLKHYVFLIVLMSFSFLGSTTQFSSNWVNFLYFLLPLAVQLYFIFLSFNINEKTDAKNFMNRIITISNVVFFRNFLLMVFIVILQHIISEYGFNMAMDYKTTDIFDVVVMFVISFIFGIFTLNSFKRIANGIKQELNIEVNDNNLETNS